ncbi:hypothetical protein I6N95_14545 [Vagococcus sp. BWB3-3]|uniref:Uncharacterized protein n=1 Tax=Vagococcus allomyrinae TaxID=2794353 RepID=A0A940PCF1_9ENTE|nr:hypothetical protein [Vagococcus allomyrinae]MBP1042235.1 hypothetical protein [Vagococcus allomyrinae]
MPKKMEKASRLMGHMIFIFALTAFLLFLLIKVLDFFIKNVSTESVLLELIQIDFKELFIFGFFLLIVLFVIWLIFTLIIFLISIILPISTLKIERYTIFLEKLTIALFPTLLLAGSLNGDSFTLVTSLVSFFAIFSFVFKAHTKEGETNHP